MLQGPLNSQSFKRGEQLDLIKKSSLETYAHTTNILRGNKWLVYLGGMQG
jgi:hypothetical protein